MTILEAFAPVLERHGAWSLAFIAFGFFIGGFVKGAVGFALPTIAVTISSFFAPGPLIIGLLALPNLAVNLWQALLNGPREAILTARRFAPLLITLWVVVLISARLSTHLSPQAFYATLGVIALTSSLTHLAGWRLHIPPGRETFALIMAGIVGGVSGGISGSWGLPVIVTLMALRLDRVTFVRVAGVCWLAGAIPFAIGHWMNGAVNTETVPWSAAMILPVSLGMWAGLKAQKRLNQKAFERWSLAALCVLGAALIGKAAVL